MSSLNVENAPVDANGPPLKQAIREALAQASREMAELKESEDKNILGLETDGLCSKAFKTESEDFVGFKVILFTNLVSVFFLDSMKKVIIRMLDQSFC